MILAFSGDPFLAPRAARRALKARGLKGNEVHELSEEMSAESVVQLASQSGLFGQVGLLLDFDSAFKGQAGVKPRNEVLKALRDVPPESIVTILDLNASPARIKTYKALGEHHPYDTPRFDKLTRWVQQEMKGAGLEFEADVPQTLADLFGEDLPSIAAEIEKLAVLGDTLSSERVTAIVNRPAARDAFDLIEQAAKGDAQTALRVCHSLIAQGEAPARILGALSWQYNLVARCVGLKEARGGRLEPNIIQQTLKVKPMVAKKAAALSRPLQESDLLAILRAMLAADVAIKTGKDEQWALEAFILELAHVHRSA